ncbi:MAG: thiolase family protein [candidate division NC10 bacterium]|nr:thiolase family protein [candidate division NC10 bacterium]MBI2163468.1 thiolase family protein [candidate division NC10 bacterium]MBI2457184.1 thiolase family protein [candidate division NC10 bacterium]
MRDAVIIDAVRTPIGKYAGALKDVRPDDLLAHVIARLVERTRVPVEAIEDVYAGCANQAGEDNRNVARMAALVAGLPIEIPGATVNRLCGSGLEAINDAARAIQTDSGDVFIAGGVESMTRAPFVMLKAAEAFPRGAITMADTTIGWRFTNPRLAALYPPESMGETAENVAEKYRIGREEQDAFALQSHQRSVAAIQAGRFKDEIVPVPVPQKKGEPVVVDTDEGPRPDTSPEKLAKLKPAFRNGGTVTAGNASQVNDGAAAVLLTSREKAKALGLQPMARILATAVAGVHPSTMGIGPVPATQKALKRAGLTMDQIELIELNEAFAAQSLACIRDLGIDQARCNVNGGAIALGHPLGCSGARILTTLLHEMRRRQVRYGLATMCIGVGQGIATIVGRL